jgi:hypothetical protein
MSEDEDYHGMVLRKPQKTALSNDCYRGCRKILGNYCESVKKNQAYRATVEAVEKLSYEKIWLNTVLERCPQYPHRLRRVKFVRGADGEGRYQAVPVEVTPENFESTTFDILHFCIEHFDPVIPCQMERDLHTAVAILWDLQHKAELHGLDDWRKLEKTCLPESWFTRTENGATEKKTFDGGCDICTWSKGHDAPTPKPAPFNFAYLRERSTNGSPELDVARLFEASDEPSSKACQVVHGGILKRPREDTLLEIDALGSIQAAPVVRHNFRKRTKVDAVKKEAGDVKRLKCGEPTNALVLWDAETVVDRDSSESGRDSFETRSQLKVILVSFRS